MNGLPTANLIAWLQNGLELNSEIRIELADRLAKLEAEIAAVNAALDQYSYDDATLRRKSDIAPLWSAVAKAVGR